MYIAPVSSDAPEEFKQSTFEEIAQSLVQGDDGDDLALSVEIIPDGDENNDLSPLPLEEKQESIEPVLLVQEPSAFEEASAFEEPSGFEFQPLDKDRSSTFIPQVSKDTLQVPAQISSQPSESEFGNDDYSSQFTQIKRLDTDLASVNANSLTNTQSE